MSTIQQNLQRVHQQIRIAAQDCGRDPQKITLLAVSKTKPITMIEAAIAAGQWDFGENYVQEGIKKIGWFHNRFENTKLIWHFISPIQSNKSRLVAGNFDWCHTLDRPQIARRLNNQRPETLAPLNVLIQININNEPTKAGIAPENMFSLAAIITQCPRLRLRGLMAIPSPENSFKKQVAVFKRMSNLYEALKNIYPIVDTLSLGMTNDMFAAIIAGSTLVRIGSAIFGDRN